ncbi:hypothetical protein XENOCAPTIV_024583, partial [Xenoophorus captivus]
VCERVFVRTLWSHCPPTNALSSSFLFLSSVFDLYSNLSAAQRKEDLRFTSHKSPQILCSFHQQMVWLLFYTTSLLFFTPAAREEILS